MSSIIGWICLGIAWACACAGCDVGGFFLGAVMFVASISSMIYLGISISGYREAKKRRNQERGCTEIFMQPPHIFRLIFAYAYIIIYT